MSLRAHSIGLFQPLSEEAPCACPSSNFYSSAAMVGRATSTNSAAGWKSTPLFQSVLEEVGRGGVLFQTLPEKAERAQSNATLKGNCNAKIKNSFMLEIHSSSCIHDRKIVLDFKLSLH